MYLEATLKSVSNMVSNALLTKHGGLAIKFKENGLSEDEIVRNLGEHSLLKSSI